MPLTALGLLLLAASLHAIWNLLVKNARQKQVFTWWALVVGAVCFAPLLILTRAFPLQVWPLVICSALHRPRLSRRVGHHLSRRAPSTSRICRPGPARPRSRHSRRQDLVGLKKDNEAEQQRHSPCTRRRLLYLHLLRYRRGRGTYRPSSSLHRPGDQPRHHLFYPAGAATLRAQCHCLRVGNKLAAYYPRRYSLICILYARAGVLHHRPGKLCRSRPRNQHRLRRLHGLAVATRRSGVAARGRGQHNFCWDSDYCNWWVTAHLALHLMQL